MNGYYNNCDGGEQVQMKVDCVLQKCYTDDKRWNMIITPDTVVRDIVSVDVARKAVEGDIFRRFAAFQPGLDFRTNNGKMVEVPQGFVGLVGVGRNVPETVDQSLFK